MKSSYIKNILDRFNYFKSNPNITITKKNDIMCLLLPCIINTKRLLSLLVFLIGISNVVLHAQQQPSARKEARDERVDAMRIAFITRKLNLTPDESKNFWPIYNQYESELETLRENHKKGKRSIKEDFENISDTELEKYVDDEIMFRQKELDILKKYHAQFKKVLPVKKIAMLFKAEQDFKKELLRQIREHPPEEKPHR